MFVKSLLLPTLFYVLTIEVVGDLDWGTVIGTYIGIILLGSAYSSLGLMTSSLTNNQIVAWILGAFFCFIFTFIGFNNFVALLPDGLGFFFRYLSSSYHISIISKGVLDFRDLLYFLSFIVIFFNCNLYHFR